VWCKNIAGKFFGLVTKHSCDRRTDGRTDRQTDGHNYDSQDCASIAASRGKKQFTWELESVRVIRATIRCRVKVQTIICDRLAVFLRVRTRNVAPETGADVIRPKLHYVNGHHAENGTEHVPAVENNDVTKTTWRLFDFSEMAITEVCDLVKPNSITLAGSELAPNMFGASSELASVMEFGF